MKKYAIFSVLVLAIVAGALSGCCKCPKPMYQPSVIPSAQAAPSYGQAGQDSAYGHRAVK